MITYGSVWYTVVYYGLLWSTTVHCGPRSTMVHYGPTGSTMIRKVHKDITMIFQSHVHSPDYEHNLISLYTCD